MQYSEVEHGWQHSLCLEMAETTWNYLKVPASRLFQFRFYMDFLWFSNTPPKKTKPTAKEISGKKQVNKTMQKEQRHNVKTNWVWRKIVHSNRDFSWDFCVYRCMCAAKEFLREEWFQAHFWHQRFHKLYFLLLVLLHVKEKVGIFVSFLELGLAWVLPKWTGSSVLKSHVYFTI